MWGALPDSVSLARPQRSEPVTVTSSPAPALQRLLTATTTGPTSQDLVSNIYSDQGKCSYLTIGKCSYLLLGIKLICSLILRSHTKQNTVTLGHSLQESSNKAGA